ncbi:hypothetical protein D5086_009879 [Populus alba]|uniref:Uncharacterized protein n=1 Tax=Populus alba TaxID=43335 RepID=A0ACC4C838_POPAL
MSKTEPLCLSLLNICKSLTTFKQIHANVLKLGLESDPFIAGKLLHHCAISLSDSLDYACRLFRYTPNPDVFMHNTLIRGLYESDRPQDSLLKFIEMRRNSLSHPDSFSFAFIVKAAANLRSVRVGIQLHCQALVHGLDTHLFVGTTLISMYGECGELQRKGMRPNETSLTGVLSACAQAGALEFGKILHGFIEKSGMHGDVKLAEQVKERLSELDPNNSSDHVLLSNAYAVAGKWKDAASVRRSMTEQRITKTPGWSMIEVDKIMYTFLAGRKQCKIAEEAYKKLKEIIRRLRVEGGYVPEIGRVLHDIEEEEKEGSVSVHSEKLAVAFEITGKC